MKRTAAIFALFILVSPGVFPGPQAPATPAPQVPTAATGGSFGNYKPIKEPLYDTWVRTSFYLPMKDGVRLAVDLLRPAKKGVVESRPLPALWTHTRYRRAQVADGKVRSSLEAPNLLAFLKRGYVLAAVDVRGSGASFGVNRGIFTPEETGDAYEITEWLARQPWCDGKIGMFGGSYLGITQLMAASRKPPHLKAIVPMVAVFDLTDVGAPNGVFRDDFVRTWSRLTQFLDLQPGVAPVDADKDGALLKAAIAEHKDNRPLIDIMASLHFRDSRDPLTGARPDLEWHPAAFVKEINASGVAVYLWGGWYDSFTVDQFLMWKNLTVPKRLTIGAWSHSPKDTVVAREEVVLLTIESLRWYDHWLKGLPTGVLDEPPIYYQAMSGPKQNEWKTAADWPPVEAKPENFYLAAESGLSLRAPKGSKEQDSRAVDYTATSGTSTRWDNAVGGGFGYPNMASNDAKGLAYTTPVLKSGLTIVGHPVVHLWASSTAKDGDFYAYLEEVDPKGVSTYVTEGVLRASFRAAAPAPYENMGLPYHRGYAEDVRDLVPGEAAELVFDLEPTSKVFAAGNRLRLTITGADKDNGATPVLAPPPVVTLYRTKDRASSISLPVVGPVALAESGVKRSLAIALFLSILVVVLTIVFTLYIRKRLATKK